MTAVSEHRVSQIFGSALLLTTVAELVYLAVWGFWLFPDGRWMGKVVWALTCAVAMGAAIGAGVLLWAEPLRNSRSALWRAAAIVVIVGSYCAVLCSALDARFNYFGGSGQRVLFLASGLLPSFLGGWLLGWWLYRWKAGNRTPTETE